MFLMSLCVRVTVALEVGNRAVTKGITDERSEERRVGKECLE